MESIWEVTFDKARLVYNIVVCPVITYGVIVWTLLDGLLRPAHQHWIDDILEQQQQCCLWAVTGSFRTTSQKQLESKAAVLPLQTYMAQLQLQAHTWMEVSEVHTKIQEACE